jgi:hypothetical protein
MKELQLRERQYKNDKEKDDKAYAIRDQMVQSGKIKRTKIKNK